MSNKTEGTATEVRTDAKGFWQKCFRIVMALGITTFIHILLKKTLSLEPKPSKFCTMINKTQYLTKFDLHYWGLF